MVYKYSLGLGLTMSIFFISCYSSQETYNNYNRQALTEQVPVNEPDLRDKNVPVEEQDARFYHYRCEEINDAKSCEECASTEMLTFVYKNIRYPDEARRQRIEGTVAIEFQIAEDGSLSDFKIKRDIGGGCGEEALRVLKGMPSFIPKYKAGQAVSSNFTMPVKFKLG